MNFVETGDRAGARGYQIFGVSLTHKKQLAMRGTSPEKLAARLAVFKRDGDTGVTLVNMERVMHKTEAARILAGSTAFLDMCVTNGHDRAAVLGFLNRVAGAAVAVPVMPTLAAPDAQAVQEQSDSTEQSEAVQEQSISEEQQATAAQADTEIAALLDTPATTEDTAQAAEPDATELLEQQEAADAGETVAEEQEESVEASRKQRRGRR